MAMDCVKNGTYEQWYSFHETVKQNGTEEDKLSLNRIYPILHLHERTSDGIQLEQMQVSGLNWNAKEFVPMIKELENRWSCFPKHQSVLLDLMQGPKDMPKWKTAFMEIGIYKDYPKGGGPSRVVMLDMLNRVLNAVVCLEQQSLEMQQAGINILLRVGTMYFLTAFWLCSRESWSVLLNWLWDNKMVRAAHGLLMVVIGFIKDCDLPTQCLLIRHRFFTSMVDLFVAAHFQLPSDCTDWMTRSSKQLQEIYNSLWFSGRSQGGRNDVSNFIHMLSRRKRNRREYETAPSSLPPRSSTESGSSVSTLMMEGMAHLDLQDAEFKLIASDQTTFQGTIGDLMFYIEMKYIYKGRTLRIKGFQDAVVCTLNLLRQHVQDPETILTSSDGCIHYRNYICSLFIQSNPVENLVDRMSQVNLDCGVDKTQAKFLIRLLQSGIWTKYKQYLGSSDMRSISRTFGKRVQLFFRDSTNWNDCRENWTADKLSIATNITAEQWATLEDKLNFESPLDMTVCLDGVGDDILGLMLCALQTVEWMCRQIVDGPTYVSDSYVDQKEVVIYAMVTVLLDTMMRWYEDGMPSAPQSLKTALMNAAGDSDTVWSELYDTSADFKKRKIRHPPPFKRQRRAIEHRLNLKSMDEMDVDSEAVLQNQTAQATASNAMVCFLYFGDHNFQS